MLGEKISKKNTTVGRKRKILPVKEPRKQVRGGIPKAPSESTAYQVLAGSTSVQEVQHLKKKKRRYGANPFLGSKPITERRILTTPKT